MTDQKKILTTFDITEILDNIPYVFCKDIHGKYQGGNLNQATSFGFYHPSEFIGKTIFDIIKDRQTAQQIDRTDNEVMQKDIQLITEETLETNSGKRIFLSQKQPIHDDNGHVTGMMGFAMDITDLKKQQEKIELEKDKLIEEKRQLELEYYANLTYQQEQFYKIVKQVAHDIASPLSAFSTIVAMLDAIPKNHRSTLELAARRIGDITNDLLKQFCPGVPENTDATAEQEVIFASLVLQNILSEKRIEFHGLPIAFDPDIEPLAYFAFVRTNKKSFQCMLSNLINNAVDAMDDKAGVIKATMRITDNHIFIEIADEGKGMPPEVRDKIMSGVAVTNNKENGHGIGMEQVRDTLRQSGASLNIKPREPVGTRVVLTFPRVAPPDWTTNRLNLWSDQIILVLDDDPSIHGAWDASFGPVLASNPKISIKHFTEAQKLLEYFAGSSILAQNRMLLLSDYELIGQHTNGIEVIKKLNLINSILVTSHYDEADVQRCAIALNVPVIPKLLATKMTIQITPSVSVQPVLAKSETSLTKNDFKNGASAESEKSTMTDIVMLDDDEVFASAFRFRFRAKKIKHFLDPRDFLGECKNYPKNTVISIDNNYGAAIPITGIEVAAQLHEQGFTRLFLVSGTHFYQSQLPPYLTYVEKMNLDYFDTV